MTRQAGNFDDFGMSTVTLAGPLPARLAAMREAGFCQVMLSARDVAEHPDGLDGVASAVQASGLRVTGFGTLRDYEGLEGTLHAYKVDVAKSMLQMAQALGARLLLVAATTSEHASEDADALARDLRKLATLAVPLGIRVAYKPLSWGRAVTDFVAAWDVVERADAFNLGVCIDAFHALAADTPLDEVEGLDPERIFLVQLADFLWEATGSPEDSAAAGHFRVFPGEGAHGEALADLVVRLDALGYRGDYSFEVFNEDYRQMPASTVARRALRAATWLGEDVLRRSVPLPNAMRLRRR